MGQWRRVIVFGVAMAVGGSLLIATAQASVGSKDHDGTYLGEATTIQGKGTMADGSTFKRQGEECLHFLPSQFMSINGGIASPLSQVSAAYNGTTPALGVSNSRVGIVWHDNETSKAQLRFRVGDGYVSGGAFKVLVGRNLTDSHAIDATTSPALDFEVFVDADETAFDAAATDQTAVQVTNNIATGSVEELALAVATDFAALTEGQWVTLNLWRDNTNTSTDSLLVFGVDFCGTFWE